MKYILLILLAVSVPALAGHRERSNVEHYSSSNATLTQTNSDYGHGHSFSTQEYEDNEGNSITQHCETQRNGNHVTQSCY